MTFMIAVIGPTAVGKSALGIALAEHLDGEIVNGDALQVYCRFDIGTAKPSPAERARVPHHLFDILDPDEAFSAGTFVRRARELVVAIGDRGRVPIVVGGSGFYVRALIEGLSPIPPVPDGVRQAILSDLEDRGVAVLHAELAEVDPPSAARIATGDRQRVSRALEVLRATGRTLSSWQKEPPAEAPLDAVRVGLTLPRSILYDRVARRVRDMVEAGWVTEVRELLASGIASDAPAFQAIGYRQIADHVLGRISLQDAVERTIIATRQYAKRQITWFRREPDVVWHPAASRSIDLLVRRLEARRRKVTHEQA